MGFSAKTFFPNSTSKMCWSVPSFNHNKAMAKTLQWMFLKVLGGFLYPVFHSPKSLLVWLLILRLRLLQEFVSVWTGDPSMVYSASLLLTFSASMTVKGVKWMDSLCRVWVCFFPNMTFSLKTYFKNQVSICKINVLLLWTFLPVFTRFPSIYCFGLLFSFCILWVVRKLSCSCMTDSEKAIRLHSELSWWVST